jgi:hypothetical protein
VSRRPGPMPAAALAVAVAVLLGACGSGAASMPPAPAAASGSPASPSSAAPAPASPSPSSSASSAAPTAIVAPSGATVALDPSLLAVLPASVGGVEITQEPESFTEALKSPGFVAGVDRAVFPIAVDGGDLVSGVVAHVRPGVWSDRFFADWRATYDRGACDRAGGVVGHAVSTFGARNVYVTTCGQGVRVYHAYLAGLGVVVSMFSLGDKRFGDQLMAGLRG